MGRLYDLIQDGTGTNYLEEGWARLDWVIDECAKRRMWVGGEGSLGGEGSRLQIRLR